MLLLLISRGMCEITFASEHLDGLFGTLEEMITRPEDAYATCQFLDVHTLSYTVNL
jgi:hypothetical protein